MKICINNCVKIDLSFGERSKFFCLVDAASALGHMSKFIEAKAAAFVRVSHPLKKTKKKNIQKQKRKQQHSKPHTHNYRTQQQQTAARGTKQQY